MAQLQPILLKTLKIPQIQNTDFHDLQHKTRYTVLIANRNTYIDSSQIIQDSLSTDLSPAP